MNLKATFPNASRDFVELNAQASLDARLQSADTKPALRNGTLAKKARKDKGAGKCAVSITSYRARSCDPDALVGKWILDSLRYAGCLFDDRPEDITYEISQKKTATKKEEKTLVTIEYP